MNLNPYETLGVGKDATPDEIKKAYRREAKKHHPDKKGDGDKFRQANEAYALLVHPARRQRFDETGKTDDPDESQRRIVNELSNMFVQAVDSLNPKHEDIVAAVAECIRDGEKKFHKFRNEMVMRKQRFEDALKRIKKSKKSKEPNIVASAFDLQILACANGIKSADDRLADAKTMMALLECYEWITDQPDFGTVTMSWMGGSTSFKATNVKMPKIKMD